jgi:hypothetical protein
MVGPTLNRTQWTEAVLSFVKRNMKVRLGRLPLRTLGLSEKFPFGATMPFCSGKLVLRKPCATPLKQRRDALCRHHNAHFDLSMVTKKLPAPSLHEPPPARQVVSPTLNCESTRMSDIAISVNFIGVAVASQAATIPESRSVNSQRTGGRFNGGFTVRTSLSVFHTLNFGTPLADQAAACKPSDRLAILLTGKRALPVNKFIIGSFDRNVIGR